MPVVGADRISEVVRALRAGGVIAMPTDTVYGIAALPADREAVRRLAEIKGRPEEQPIAVLLDSAHAITDALEDPHALDAVRRFWPGPLTAIVRVRADYASPLVTPERTLGVRVPDDDLARSLIRESGGALAVTSANRTSEAPATTAVEVVQAFGEALLVLDGGVRDRSGASTVVDLTGETPRVLREGAVSEAQLRAAFAEA